DGTRSRFGPGRRTLSCTREADTWPQRAKWSSRRKVTMRKSLIAASLLSLTVAMAPACATKKYVRTEVGGVNSKVDTLSGTVEQTQGRIQQDEAKIGQVDQKAEAAGKSAETAQNSANAAQQAARQAAARADQVNTDLSANIAAGRKLVYEVTLSEDQGNFKFGKTELPDEAKMRIDQV